MDAGESDVRRRIAEAVIARPGIHLRDLGRTVGTSLSGVLHHIRVLERQGVIVGISDRHYRRYFSSTLVLPTESRRLSEDDRKLLGEIQRPMSLAIVLNLAVDGPLGHRELGRRLGKSKSTTSYHLDRLVTSGFVRPSPASSPERYELSDAKRATALLVTFSGALRDRYDAFADLWLTLGRRDGNPPTTGPR